MMHCTNPPLLRGGNNNNNNCSTAKSNTVCYYLDTTFTQKILNVGAFCNKMTNSVISDQGAPGYVDRFEVCTSATEKSHDTDTFYFSVAYDQMHVKMSFNPLIATENPQSNGPANNNTVIGTLHVDGWAVTFGTARTGLGEARARPGPSSLYQI